MQLHQQRVIDEQTELQDKITKLVDFINLSPVFAELDSKQQKLLQAQLGAMEAYVAILNLRVAYF